MGVLVASFFLLVSGLPSGGPGPARAAPVELFFSEYIEGSSNNKALEIYNGTGAAVDLATGAYNVQMFFNGNPVSTLTINLTGTVAVGDVYVLAQSSANATILAQADQTNGSGWFNGDDAVVLRKGTTVVDAIGQVGFDPGTEWGAGLTSTADNTLRRRTSIGAGDPNGADVFDPSIEWDGYATDMFDGLGAHTYAPPVGDAAPAVATTFPIDGATSFPIASDLSVTFSEPVNVTGTWYSLVCSTSGAVAAAVSGGPTTFTLNPSADLVGGETCTLTVVAANVSDQDASDPPDTMVANFTAGFSVFDVCAQPYTRIYDIQGSGATVALTGTQTTQGVVVGDYEGPSPALRGFFIQDPIGDGNAPTSDGIFVFEGSNANTVSLGDVVRVTGNAGENQGQSQISVGTIVKCGTGTVAPTDVTFPVASADFLERYEGMLARLPQTMYVTEHFQLGRFGQVVLSSGGRLLQPTNIYEPGPDAAALQAANTLNRIIVDDASQAQNPDPILFARGGLPLSASNTLRGGDTATGIVGVLNYTWAGNSASGNAYRIRPINALNGFVNFEPTNPRPASAPAVGGTLQVAGMNLLNYYNTFDGLPDGVDNCANGVGGIAADCRGADTLAEFDRQWPKTVAAILSTSADVVGLVELENDGYGTESAIAHLVDRLNVATAPGTWAFVDADAGTGQVNALGVDAIKVGMIYRPALVTPVGQTAVLNSVAFVNGGDSTLRGRPSLAQAFELNATGGRFIVDVNHFKSKGSACDIPDAGDGQGNCNVVRVNAATELVSWLATDPTGTGDPDVLIVGDYNAYAMEDPITVIRNAGFTNLIELFGGPDAYSYVFEGQWGYLDQALGSAAIVPQVTGVAEHHINADEPSVLDYNTDFKTANLQATLYAPDQFRVSDHDPVVIGLEPVNYSPELDEITVTPNPVALGTAVNASVSFTDPDKLDTHTASWHWGDGITSAGIVTEAAGSGTITGSHTYAAQGVYTVTVTVDDGYGNTDSATFEFVVVYDPNGPFVTGGGWFTSQAGTFKPVPAASGRTYIGFVSRYLPGSITPSGSVRLAFHPAGLDFRSTALQWMVVTGSPATARIKGAGTVSGEAGYTFQLTATDDRRSDRVSFTIWDPLGGLFYQVGERPLTKGSVIIHKAK
jgi:predicted extracellular nuclease